VILPESLSHEPLQFQKIIEVKEELNQDQLTLALRKFLAQWGISPTEKQEASYLLAKLLQKSSKQSDLEGALAGFQVSKDFEPLRQLSLWHGGEVAALIGKEKVVRELLNQFLNGGQSEEDRAKAQYGLAQSYLRGNEPDKARAAFEAIQKQYPGSPYAIGSNYYLGEITWDKATAQKPDAAATAGADSASPSPDNQLNDAGSSPATTASATTQKTSALQVTDVSTLKSALDLFVAYLRLSPTGHFSENARGRLQEARAGVPLQLTSDQFDAIAYSFYASGKWIEALSLWSQYPRENRLLEVATCQAHTHQITAARATLLRAVKSPAGAAGYVPAANYVCLSLSKEEATNFWKQVLQALSQHRDGALWNIAIRLSPPASLQYFQKLANEYPSSRYAAESHWWLFWEAAQHKTGKELLSLIPQADKLAQTYKSSRAAPRFLFWAGKIAEHARNGKQAADDYRNILHAYSSDYYAFRAADRLAQLEKKSLPFGWLKKYIGAIPDSWSLPEPSKLKNNELSGTVTELIKLKEYEEPLQFLTDHDTETKAWLLGKLHQPIRSIATATKELQEASLKAPVWQYAYPLHYSSEIQDNCRKFSNVDPYLMHSLVREESHYDPDALSSSKAIGLTQVMPGTAYGVAKLLRITVTDPKEFFSPALNLKLGTEYFSYTLSRFQNNSLYAVAGYNGGAGAVKSWVSKEHARGNDDPDAFVENIPFRETREYVRKVFGSYWNYIRVYGKLN
jgi:soluble lytic murein transglycosylase